MAAILCEFYNLHTLRIYAIDEFVNLYQYQMFIYTSH